MPVVADLIALSVVMSVGACSGPYIPLRVGRVDAVKAGAFGVPQPETGIEETLREFSNAGFDKSDSIALTACGHTMWGDITMYMAESDICCRGSVHNGGFPQVGWSSHLDQICVADSISLPSAAISDHAE
jgi:hypothetical protein